MNMGLEKLPHVVYHATTTEYEDSLRQGINLNIGRDKVDFGKGFYTTSNIDQARKWSKSKANFRNNEIELNKLEEQIEKVEPLIITYSVDIDSLIKLHGKIFKAPDIEWAKYIADNRLNKEPIKGVHYTYGPLADAKIAKPLYEYKIGKIDIDEFWKIVSPTDLSTNQMSFHTIESLKCLERSDQS